MREKFSATFGIAFFGIGLCLGMSACTAVPLDHSISAAAANDATVPLSMPKAGSDPSIEGCNQLRDVGFLFCRLRAGSNPTAKVTITVPGATCKRQHCTQYQLTRKDGSYGKGGALEKNQTQIQVSVADIIGTDTALTADADGEYQVLIKTYFLGPDGQEYKSIGRGIIRLVVLHPGYLPLTCNDPNTAWTVRISPKCRVEFSSSLRAVLCGSCEG